MNACAGSALRTAFSLVGVALFASQTRAYAFTEVQARTGTRIYAQQCARCHGTYLEGKDNAYRGLRAPTLLGSSALPCQPRAYQKLRQQPFRTLRDVYAFVSATMPAEQPASLSAGEYWDVLAFILQANGIAADGTRLDEAAGRQFTLHNECSPATAAVARQGQS
jgi:cytochrome c